MTNEELDAHLDAADSADPDNSLAIFARIHERRRARQHAKHKAEQPRADVKAGDWGKLLTFTRAPLTDDDRSMEAGAMDYLLLTVQAAVDDAADGAGTIDDFVFALLRVWRKCWAAQSHHLGPVEGVEAQQRAAREEMGRRVVAPLGSGER